MKLSVATLLLFTTVLSALPGEGREDGRYKGAHASKFQEKVMKRIHNPLTGKTCFDLIKKGGVPSANQHVSPLKQFGMPHFELQHGGKKTVILNPGVALSYISHHRQPMKLGLQDFAFAGTADEILAFMACFDGYEAIGVTMDEHGKWTKNTGSIKVQVENLDTQHGKHETVFEILFKYTLDRIVKYIDPGTKILDSLDAIVMGSKALMDAVSFARTLKELSEHDYIVGNLDVTNEILKVFKEKATHTVKEKEIIKYFEALEKVYGRHRNQWVERKNVDLKRKMVVTLSMYSKPEHTVRSTFYTGKHTVTMAEIGEAFIKLLDGH